MKSRLILLPLLALNLATPVGAQGGAQTSENAKRFLSQALVGSSVHWEFGNGSYVKVRIGKYNQYTDPHLAECRVKFYGTYTYANGGGRDDDFIIFFEEMREARQEGAAVILKYSTSTYTLNLNSGSMAARVAYAMEFMHQSCDKLAETGF